MFGIGFAGGASTIQYTSTMPGWRYNADMTFPIFRLVIVKVNGMTGVAGALCCMGWAQALYLMGSGNTGYKYSACWALDLALMLLCIW